MMSRGGRFVIVMASVLMLAACSGNAATPATLATPATSSAPGQTQTSRLPASATEPECRNALVMIDAYILAKQAGGSNDADAASSRARCLASPDVPQSCIDAMSISVTIAKVSINSVEWVSAYTAYGEASTLCRLKLLKSI
jgi:hypothetical protein